MTISTVDDIAAGLALAQRIRFIKNLVAPKSANAYVSSWLATGWPGAGATPPVYTAGSGYTVDKSSAGALPYLNGAVQNWVARASLLNNNGGMLILYDRLWSCSGIPFGAGTYAITTPGSLPARITDNGVGCELWIENFVNSGASSGTLTANYLNAATGAAGAGIVPSGVLVSSSIAGQVQPVPLAAGDTGIRQLTNVVTSNTWTSGSFGMTIMKRIAEFPVGPGISALSACVYDWADCLSPLSSDVCLAFVVLSYSANATAIVGNFDVIDK